MNLNIRIVFLTLIIFSTLRGGAQTYYSVDRSYRLSKENANNLITDFRDDYPDTSLLGFHHFFPRNFLGNYGLPSPEYILNYGTDDIGFRLYESPYRNSRFSGQQINYYRSKGPYAELTGIAGSKQLQIFKLFFTHTYKRVNVSIRFNRYTSQGFYQRQQTFTNNFYLSSNFKSKNDRAGYYFNFLNNGNRHGENGGIKSDTLNDKTLLQGKDILPVKITNASRDNKQYGAEFNPWLKLNQGKDSASDLNFYLQTKSAFNIEMMQYKDQNIYTDRYYLLMYHDTARTFDSTYVFKLANSAHLTMKSHEDFALSAGYKHELNKVWQKTDSAFSNHIVQSEALWRKKFGNDSIIYSGAESSLNAAYVISGPNSGNYKAEIRNKLFSGKHQLYINALIESRSADYIYNYWISNHFTWFNNRHLQQEKLQAMAAYNYSDLFGASVLLNTYRNYLYFDEVVQPRQYGGDLQSIKAGVFVNKVFFKHIGIFADYNWQKVSDETYLRVPEHALTARLYYTGSHFKNNLVLNIGSQLQYYSFFYGYGYMPAMNVFYLQEKYKTSPFPFVDLYLNARIRPVNVFIKIENILHGYAGTGYSFVPGYYQPDRAFRFGLSWMFFD